MNFELTEEQIAFREAWREVVRREVAPLVEEAENGHRFPVQLFPKLGKLGYLCIRYPRELGAKGLGMLESVIYTEELAKVCSGITGTLSAGSLATVSLLQHGTQEQKERYLMPGARGERIGCFAMTEPSAGSDASAMQTTADRVGDDYVLNGAKTFIGAAPIADFAVIAACTNKEAGPGKGISLIVVDKGTPGFSEPRNMEKMGNHSAMVGEFTLQDCRVSAANLVGEEGRGLRYSLESVGSGRIEAAAHALGVGQAAFEAAVDYVKHRVQFGQPIGKFQVIQFRLAHLAAELESVRWLVYRAASLADLQANCIKEATMAKLLASEVVLRATDAAVQVHGGYGYMKEYPVERYYRDARQFTLVVGTSEVMQMIIARELGL